MTVDQTLTLFNLLTNFTVIFKAGFILFAIAYFVFSLIVIRQVTLMTETIITEGGAILRAVSILHAGIALGVIILFIGLL